MPPKGNRAKASDNNGVAGKAGNVNQNRTPSGPISSVCLNAPSAGELIVCPKLPPGKVNIRKDKPDVTVNICSVKLNNQKITQVFQYDVKFEPEVTATAQKRFIFYNVMNLTGNLPWIAYDGSALAYSVTPFTTKRFNATEVLGSASTDPFGVPFAPRKAEAAVPEAPAANPEAGKDGKDAKAARGPQFMTITSTVSYTIDNIDEIRQSQTSRDLSSAASDALPVQTALSAILRHAHIYFCIHAEINQKKKRGYQLDDRSLFEMDSFIVKNSCIYRYPLSVDGYKALGGGLYNIFGSYSSLRMLERGLSLHIDIAPMPVFKRDANVVDILQEIAGGRLESAPISTYKNITTYRAITTHLAPGKNRRVPLQLIGARAGDTKFQLRRPDGTPGPSVTLVQYFKQVYKLQINPNYYTYGVETRGEKQWYPIEVLQITGGKPWNGDLSAEQTTAMLGLTTTRPNERLKNAFEQLQILSKSVAYIRQKTRGSSKQHHLPGGPHADVDSVYQNFVIDEKYTKVPSRQLPPPTIISTTGGPKVEEIAPQYGAFRLNPKARFTKPANNGAPVNTVLISCSRISPEEQQTYVKELTTRAGFKGLKLQQPSNTFNIRANPVFNPKDGQALETFLQKEKAASKGPLLVLAILESGSPYYGFLKRTAETKFGLVSQCAEGAKIRKNIRNGKNLSGYLDNINLKINVKLGGENYSLKPSNPANNRILTTYPDANPSGPFSSTVPVMVVGFDVYHDPKTRSHAAFVATYNRELTRYNSCVVQQPQVKKNNNSNVSQEMISTANVQRAIESLLNDFYKANQGYPQHIVVYRDGLSDSQLATSMEFEIPGIIAGAQSSFLANCPATNTPYNPTITFIVAVKRHHIRFQPEQGNDEPLGRNGTTENLPGGSVIDTSIVRKDITEFYLQAQASALGTGRSTLYQVCYCSDHKRVTSDDLQLLTYYLSWGHQRALKATFIPTPVYFADILCYRARYYDPNWENRDAPNRDGSWSFRSLPPALNNKSFWL